MPSSLCMKQSIYMEKYFANQRTHIGNFDIITSTLLLMMLWHDFIGVSDIISRIPSPANVAGKIKGNGKKPTTASDKIF